MTASVEQRLSEIGVSLGAPTIAWGRRPETKPVITLTPRDRQLLSTLHDFNYLTTTMLALLFWGRIGTAAAARLKLLHDAGYIEKFRPRVRRTEGSREWIYRLTEQGWHDVVVHAAPANGDDYRPADLTSISYVEHDLQVNALILHIALLAAEAPGRVGSGGLLERLPFRLCGPRSGVVRPSDDTRLEPAEPSVSLEQSTPGILAPDATLLGTDRQGQRTAVMIEYDRTRRAHKQIAKLRRYDWFLTSGWTRSRYSTLDIEPAVLFVCANDAQLPGFLKTADKHLSAWTQDGTGRGEREHNGREQIAFTSRQRLLRSDWRAVQVDPCPPHTRPSRRVVPTTIDVALPSLFAPPALAGDLIRPEA